MKHTKPYIEILQQIKETPELAVFHQDASNYKDIIYTIQTKYTPTNPETLDPEVVQKGYAYGITLPSDELNFLKKNITAIIIDIQRKDLPKSKKYPCSLQAICKYDALDHFLNQYFTHMFSLTKNAPEGYKTTKLAITIGEILVRFLMQKIPLLNNSYNCFENFSDFDSTKQEQCLTFYKNILQENLASALLTETFKSLAITNVILEEIIYHYFTKLCFSNFRSEKISFLQLKELIRSAYTADKQVASINNNNERLLKLGHLLIDYLEEYKIFSTILKSETVRKETKQSHMLIPNEIILNQLLQSNMYNRPFLTIPTKRDIKKNMNPMVIIKSFTKISLTLYIPTQEFIQNKN